MNGPLTRHAPLDAATLLGVAAEPVRWELLRTLGQGPQSVCDLRPVAPLGPSALSHHLEVLREAGLVTAVRRGRWIDYALAPDALQRLRDALPVGQAGFRPRPSAASGSVVAQERA